MDTPKALPERFSYFVDAIVFIDLLVTVFIGQNHPLVLKLVILGSILLAAILGIILRPFRVIRYVTDVKPHFKIVDNVQVWRNVVEEYAYIGISGGSFLSEFRNTVEQGIFNPGCRLRFLLLAPEADCVRESKKHELGREPNNEEVSAEIRRINSTAESYLGMRGKLELKVRFYREYARYWAHYVDDREGFIGYLLRGRSGLRDPVLILKRGHHHNPLLRHFLEEFDRLWHDDRFSEDAETFLAKKRGAHA